MKKILSLLILLILVGCSSGQEIVTEEVVEENKSLEEPIEVEEVIEEAEITIDTLKKLEGKTDEHVIFDLLKEMVKLDPDILVKKNLTKKEIAGQAALKMIQSLYQSDCKEYASYFDNQVYFIEDEDYGSKKELERSFCNGFNEVVPDGKLFSDYYDEYNLYIYNKTEFDYAMELEDDGFEFNMQDSDYLFYSRTEGSKAIMYELSSFIIRDTNDGWKIIAFLG